MSGVGTIPGWRAAVPTDQGGAFANTETPTPAAQPAQPAQPAPAPQQPGTGDISSIIAAITGGNPGSAAQTPAYLSSLFPNGLPQQAVAQAGPTAPVQAGSALAQMNGSLDPGALTQKILAADQPVFQQQQRGLTESLANAGIVGGSTAGAVGNLANQQDQQATAQLAPFEQTANAQRLQGAEGDVLAQLQAQQGNQRIDQQGNQFDAASMNAGNQFNIANLISGGLNDTSSFNSMQQFLDSLQNQDWMTQLGLQGQLTTAGAGAQSAAYQPVFQQPAQTNLSGLAAAFAPKSTGQPQPGAGLGPSYQYGYGNPNAG